MTPDVHRELEELVGEIGILALRLRAHGQPLAMQLLEMAVLEIKSRMYGIADEEVQALSDTLSGQTPPGPATSTRSNEQAEAIIMPSSRVVVALGEIGRDKRKRWN